MRIYHNKQSSLHHHKGISLTLLAKVSTTANDGDNDNNDDTDRTCSLLGRRRLLLSAPTTAGLLLLLSGTITRPARAVEISNDNNKKEEVLIYQLASGVQFRNIRKGSGPTIQPTKTIDGEEEDDDESDDATIVVLHLKAMTSNGVPLFNTFDQNPILYKLGTSTNFDVFGGDSSKRPKVTQGVEDAILSRGTTTGILQNGILTPQKLKVEPMKEGGVRRIIVPSRLAYGHAGVSRYDAFRMGLKNPVPRDQDILYDVEVLRCNNVEVNLPTRSNDTSEESNRTATIRACCNEDNYPCKTPEPQETS